MSEGRFSSTISVGCVSIAVSCTGSSLTSSLSTEDLEDTSGIIETLWLEVVFEEGIAVEVKNEEIAAAAAVVSVGIRLLLGAEEEDVLHIAIIVI